MIRTECTPANRPLLAAAAGLLLATMLAGCGPSGPATQVNQPTGTATVANYTGPAPSSKDVQAFEVSLWNNVRSSDRCGGCHYAGGQSPQFARSDDVNLAYQAALPLVNTSQPGESTLVIQVGGGHNCWVASPQACADTMLTWIQNWIGGGSGAAEKIQLVPPPDQSVGGTKTFPSDPSSFSSTVYPMLRQFCSGCHDPNSSTPQAPYFASSDLNQAYIEAQPKINLDDPAASRFVERLATESHHCWPTTSGGAPDCPGSANQMLTAITNFANGIQAVSVPSSWVISKALMLQQGIIASGGSRFDSDTIAKYEFKEGTGSTAYDTSGVSPEADLTVSGNITWDQAWGVIFGQGSRAQALTTSSQKIANLVQTTGEYSIEVWASPANITQAKANIVSYSGSDTARDVTLGQDATQYQAQTRSDKTDTNGMPPLLTSMTGNFVQAALQHIVLTYDPVNGQKLYVNGQFTGDVDPNGGGSLANWDNTFALVLGNETTGDRQWLGEIRFLAIHDSALTPAQITQNFNAGVGQKYYLLFDVSSIVGIPQSYIMMTAAQYDNYSYLFYDPTFITLTANAQPQNIPIKGMRIGINGQVPTVGQSFSTLNTTIGGSAYTASNGQLLSSVGAVIGVDTGVASDMFFLSFEQLGNQTNVYVEPTVPPNPTVYDNSPQPDYGVHTFAEVNAAMSTVTGVPVSDSAVSTAYANLEQSLPAVPQISAFTASEQTAISQLAGAYCGELVGNASYRDNFFGTGLDAAISGNQTSSAFFGTNGPNANQDLVITPLVTALAVGTTVDPTFATALQGELAALFNKIPTLSLSYTATVSVATQAACQAALGSAALTLK
ncbi:MAG TPA: LamG domain-containing protein [Steroidobacteraceae bacterium]|nr:LamG domain-containing protein [Steroidobacteraceae bacterium]